MNTRMEENRISQGRTDEEREKKEARRGECTGKGSRRRRERSVKFPNSLQIQEVWMGPRMEHTKIQALV